MLLFNFTRAIITIFGNKACYVCCLDSLSLSALEDTVVALSVTGILKVWLVTSEVGGMQVRQLRLGNISLLLFLWNQEV
jgi:hypothetical protein